VPEAVHHVLTHGKTVRAVSDLLTDEIVSLVLNRFDDLPPEFNYPFNYAPVFSTTRLFLLSLCPME
jgi:hypothetical protein